MTLSNKISQMCVTEDDVGIIAVKDVKEFIKELKAEFMRYRAIPEGEVFLTKRDKVFLMTIDALAGDKLI